MSNALLNLHLMMGEPCGDAGLYEIADWAGELLMNSSDSVLLDSLKKITQELCYDYPNIANAGPIEQLYALEQSYRGISAACDDLHDVIEKLRIICGITKEEVAKLFDIH